MTNPTTTTSVADSASVEAACQQLVQRAATAAGLAETQALLADALRQQGMLLRENQQLRAEKHALATRADRLQAVFDSSLYVVQVFEAVRDATGRIVDFTWVLANHTWNKLYGNPVGKRLLAENPGVVVSGLFEQFVHVTETGAPIDHEQFYNYEQFDGWFHQTLLKLGDGFVMHTEDITARKRVEQCLRESRELLQATIDSSLNMVQVFEAVRDEQGKIIDFNWILNNQVSEKIYGDVIGQRLLARNPGVVETGIFETFKQVVETGVPDQHERHYTHEQFNGWFHQSTVKLRDGVATTTTDISERKRNEQEILQLKDTLTQQAENRYRTLFTSIDEGFCVIELVLNAQNAVTDYRFLEVNPVFGRQTGLANVLGRLGSELTPGTESHWLTTYGEVARTGQPIRFENYHRPTGRWYEVHASRVDGAGSQQVCIVFNDVTKRKQAEAALKENEARKSFLLQLSDALSPLADAVAIQEAMTRLAFAFFGADRCYYGELADGNFIVRHDAASAGLPSVANTYDLESLPVIKAMLKANRPFVVADVQTTTLLAKPLRQRCVQHQVIALLGIPVAKNGQPVGMLCVMQSTPRTWTPLEVELASEIAERTWAAVERAKTERALRESEERLRTLVENLPGAAVFVVDTHLRYLVAEGDALHQAGFRSADFVGRTVREVLPPELWPLHETHYRAALAGQSFALEHEARGRAFATRGVPLHHTAGQAPMVLAVSYDITERRRAETALRESEARLAAFNQHLERQVAARTQELRDSRDTLQSLFDTNLVAMSVLRAVRDEAGAITDFRIVLVSPETERQTGRTDLVGRLYAQEFPGIVPTGLYDLLLRTVATGQPQHLEYHYNHEGLDGWYACQFVKLDDGVVATNLDITERKLAEQELLQYVGLLEQSEDVAQLGSWVYELATGALRWSAGMYQLFQLAPGTPVQPAIYLRYVVADDRAAAERVVQALTTAPANFTETLRFEVRGSIKMLRIKAIVLRGEDGTPVRMLGIDFDVTEIHRLEAENLHLRLTQQQQRIEAVLAAQEEERRRISESLHNGLGQLLYATKLQLDSLPPDARNPARAEASRLLSEAIHQTRVLSHELTPALLEEFGLETALQSICHSLSSRQLHWHCYVVLDEAPPLPPLLQTALYRLAQELAQNVTKHAQARSATIEVAALPGWAVLRVEDDGRGFDPAALSDGIGLRTLRSRVALLGGTLHLTSEVGHGSTFQIRLPVAPA